MSAFTDDDVRAVGLAIDATMPLHGSEEEQIDYAARAVLAAVAPAIAARALREEADFVSKLRRSTAQHVAEYLRARADEIERTP
jgi:hypothetical protein